MFGWTANSISIVGATQSRRGEVMSVMVERI
jgi:hypothetical protein